MKTALASLLVFAGAIIGPPPTNATPSSDQAFVNLLAKNGIVINGPALLVGNSGRKICTLAEYGWTQDMLISSSAQYDYPQLTDSQAATFMSLAMQTYCP